jgi:predicted Zn-dependent protease
VKVLRFFMGIPGGNRERGIREMESAMNNGELMNVDARFYLARGLRTYDLQYQRAAQVLEPLTQQYPRNPLFMLLLGNLNSELNRTEAASRSFHPAQASLASDPVCAARVKELAQSALAATSHR